MNAPAERHTGLPYVPQPAPNELLGSWLLRVAQLYSLGLTTLLSRLGARPPGDPRVSHWFAIDGASVILDALSAASRLSRVDLAAMASPPCLPRWPEELGACASCLVHAADAGQPITWNQNWMNPLATVCSIHGTWLTPVATRTLAGVRHAGDFGGVVQHIAAAQALLDCEPPCAGDALWLQELCNARMDVRLPWGMTRPHDLIRIVDAVAREVISASDSHTSALGPPAVGLASSVKDFVFESAAGQRAAMSLPPRLRQRQRLLARVADVLQRAPEARTFHCSWPPSSTRRLASKSTCNWPSGSLAWICPEADELAKRQHSLQAQFGFSPTYFKAYSALLASVQ